MSVVRSEFGPTLPELLRPLPRVLRLLLLALAALPAVAVIAWALFGRGGAAIERVVVKQEPSFNIGFVPPLEKLEPRAGELARLGSDDASVVVRPLRLGAYKGDASGVLPIRASLLAARLQKQRPELVIRGEGRVNINRVQGYRVSYQFPGPGGKRWYGRAIMLLPDPTAREGVEMTLEAAASGAIPNVDAVGTTGALKTTMRSFRFGTEGP